MRSMLFKFKTFHNARIKWKSNGPSEGFKIMKLELFLNAFTILQAPYLDINILNKTRINMIIWILNSYGQKCPHLNFVYLPNIFG